MLPKSFMEGTRMPVVSRPQLTPALLTALLVSLICGCENQDADFHTFQEQAPDLKQNATKLVTPVSPSRVVPASAETIKTPPELSAIPSVPTRLPVPAESSSKFVGPASIGDALTSPPVAPVETPEPAKPASPELALSIPPAPPVAVALNSLTAQPATTLLPTRKMQLLIPEKTFKVEGPEGAIRVSFDDVDLLKVLNVDPVPVDIEKDLPSWLSGLHGKTVRIRGWMFPPPIDKELPAFLFVRDNEICCFGRKPLVYDKFGVRMRPGGTTDYISGRPFDVVGRMVVKSRIEDGELFWLYLIEDAVVISK